MKRDWNLLLIMALIFIVVGLGLLVKNLVLLNTGITTEGEVIDIIKKKGTSRTTTSTLYPVVTFNLENGEPRTVNLSRQSSSRIISYRVGDKIKLVYPKDDYKKVQIHSFVWIYGFSGIMILMGIIGWGLGSFDFENAP